ncbi:MAG TPA: 2-oxo acid dehydrogenase subunit E2 [Candidatus Thermoplasmatota archaeon]|nr:2-oxo acid dehydrogenase subunit E2 [Candidatus Thermoplasmatota archaeon]
MALPAFQKFTAATWNAPRDPSILADVSVDAEPLEALIREEKAKGRRVTVTSIVARCVGYALERAPDLNVEFRRGAPRRRKYTDAWITFTDDRGRLSGKRFDAIHRRSLHDIQKELDEAAARYRAGRSDTGKRTNWLIRILPIGLIRRLMRFESWLVYTFGIGKSLMGVDKGLFGAVHITNVGTFGLRHVGSPIPTFIRIAFQLNVGAIYDTPIVRHGKVVAGRRLPIVATVDHRAVVGNVAGVMAAAFTQAIEDPARLRSFLTPATDASASAR